jgi:hypothetical protein
MRLAFVTLLLLSLAAQFTQAQIADKAAPTSFDSTVSSLPASNPGAYTVLNATPVQEAALKAQIGQIHPDVLPLRIIFVPHWKYLESARAFQLHVPTGFGSVMFTHLPSRTVFIDNDRYLGEDWLAHWFAHELGHLATNSPKEEDAERIARQYRKRLKTAQQASLAEQNHTGHQ